jgi:NAD(P)H-hydrate epimerase
MAKGGSGDALTGMITAFLSQNYSSIDAAILGVYLHGLAGDKAVLKTTEYGLLASDLIESIPDAIKEIL